MGESREHKIWKFAVADIQANLSTLRQSASASNDATANKAILSADNFNAWILEQSQMTSTLIQSESNQPTSPVSAPQVSDMNTDLPTASQSESQADIAQDNAEMANDREEINSSQETTTPRNDSVLGFATTNGNEPADDNVDNADNDLDNINTGINEDIRSNLLNGMCLIALLSCIHKLDCHSLQIRSLWRTWINSKRNTRSFNERCVTNATRNIQIACTDSSISQKTKCTNYSTHVRLSICTFIDNKNAGQLSSKTARKGLSSSSSSVVHSNRMTSNATLKQ